MKWDRISKSFKLKKTIELSTSGIVSTNTNEPKKPYNLYMYLYMYNVMFIQYRFNHPKLFSSHRYYVSITNPTHTRPADQRLRPQKCAPGVLQSSLNVVVVCVCWTRSVPWVVVRSHVCSSVYACVCVFSVRGNKSTMWVKLCRRDQGARTCLAPGFRDNTDKVRCVSFECRPQTTAHRRSVVDARAPARP